MTRTTRNRYFVFVLFIMGVFICSAPVLADPKPDQLMLVKGDLNNNGIIDIADAIMAMQILVGGDAPGWELFAVADVDGDGTVGLAEAVYILQVIANLRDPLLVPCWRVTFKDHDGAVLKMELVEHGRGTTAPNDPKRTGYTFTGWDVAFDTITEHLNINAQYVINQYTLTFDSAGGAAVDPITQDFDTAVSTPADPTRVGYTFSGWNPIVPETMPAGGLTLTAQWTINQYTLTYTAGDNGSITGETNQTVEHGSAGSPVEAIPNDDWYFLEWSDGSTKNPRADTNVAENINVLAVFAISDPNTPKHLHLSIEPSIILSDGNDYSTLTANITPYEGGIIPDGTEVEFQIISGSAHLDPLISGTINGIATTRVTATKTGTVSIGAQVRDTNINASRVLTVTSSFENQFTKSASSGGSVINGVYQAGYQFTFRITNRSARTFALNKFEFKNGTATVTSTTDKALLNKGQLAPGETVGLTVSLGWGMRNNGFRSIYYLSVPGTQSGFTVSRDW